MNTNLQKKKKKNFLSGNSLGKDKLLYKGKTNDIVIYRTENAEIEVE